MTDDADKPVTLPRMLIVDDECANLELFERAFRRKFEIRTAERGADALVRLEEQTADVILSDRMMPGMDGIEFLRRSVEPAPHAVRVLVTGHADVQSVTEGVNSAGLQLVFHKPVDLKTLRTGVQREVDKQQQQRRLRDENAELREQLAELDRRVQDLVAIEPSSATDTVGAACTEDARKHLEECLKLLETLYRGAPLEQDTSQALLPELTRARELLRRFEGNE